MKKTLILTITFVIVVALIGCGKTFETKESLISTKNIEKISVELFDKSTKEFKGDSVNQITDTINTASLTEKESVDDSPNIHPFGKITINDGEEIIYYYQKNGKSFLEKPYTGIYKISVDINSFFENL